MKIIENILLFAYFVLTVCGLRVTYEEVSSKPYTIWGNRNGHGDQDQLMEIRSKRSLPECGVHAQEPTIDSLSSKTTMPGEWPWVVAVFGFIDKVLTYQCGGSLIGNRFAITAADCIYSYDNRKQMETKDVAIIVGAKDLSRNTYDEGKIRFLTAMYIHEEYELEANNNNIALLVLKEPVTYFKLVKPVCLWEGEDDQDDLGKAFQHGTIVGWGQVNGFVTLSAPHRFNMSIISFTTCRELDLVDKYGINEKNFCAATKDTRVICLAISGVGLYIKQHGRWMLRGMASENVLKDYKCRRTNIYTDVAKHRNWINDTMYRWSQTNIPPVASTNATGNNLAWDQQCSMNNDVNPQVVQGAATREGDWPWHIAIYHNEHKGSSASIRYMCGGSLISDRHVLTAAHCLIDTTTGRPLELRRINIYLGNHNINTFSVGVQFKLADKLEIHKEYNWQTQYKDIAVVKLSSPVEFTATVKPVCLWPEDEVDLSHVTDKYGSVVGWGSDKYGQLADKLKLAELPVVSDITCLRSHPFYQKYTNNYTFCAGVLPETDTSVCNGDSGGGMVFKLQSPDREGWFLRGIVSFRPVAGNTLLCDFSRYTIFTDVAKYLDWIKEIVSRDI